MNAISAAMLAKPPPSHTDLFMKNKGGTDGLKPLNKPKQWNTWQHTFLCIMHSHDFKEATDATYVPDGKSPAPSQWYANIQTPMTQIMGMHNSFIRSLAHIIPEGSPDDNALISLNMNSKLCVL